MSDLTNQHAAWARAAVELLEETNLPAGTHPLEVAAMCGLKLHMVPAHMHGTDPLVGCGCGSHDYPAELSARWRAAWVGDVLDRATIRAPEHVPPDAWVAVAVGHFALQRYALEQSDAGAEFIAECMRGRQRAEDASAQQGAA